MKICSSAPRSLLLAGAFFGVLSCGAAAQQPANAPALKQWAQDYWTAIHPFNLPGAYANFMMDDEGDARVRAAYGGNYERLARLKKKYDPANLFHVNQNVRPAA